MKTLLFSTVACLALGSQAFAATVNLNDWSAEDYAPVGGFPAANWQVTPSGASVTQTLNGQPAIFYSDTNAFGTKVTGKASVSGASDDDFFGFVLGFTPGDTINASADYLLIDWKRGSQSFNFGGGAANATPGGLAPAGLALSRVTGTPTADEFWQHEDLAGNSAGGVTELGRGTTLGATGWSFNTVYEFSFDFGPNNLIVEVDGVEQFNVSGNFSDGRLGFYNFSQDPVTYEAFTTEVGTFPAVPLPASSLLLLAGIAGFAGLRRTKG